MFDRERKNSSEKNRINTRILLGGALVVAVIFAILLFPGADTGIYPVVTVEAGSASVDPNAFLKKPTGKTVVFLTELTGAQLAKPGVYEITLAVGDDIHQVTLKVQDTVAPVGTVVNLKTEGSLPNAADFVADIQDVSPVTVIYKNLPDLTVEGVQEVVLILEDSSGNQTELSANLTVEPDREAPVIIGAKDIQVYQGEAVFYRNGITVVDGQDKSPRLTVDNSRVDLSAPGTYPLVYIASDASGNERRVEVAVTVLEKQHQTVAVEVIYEAVDQLLGEIITDGMTKREQVVAIYDWMRDHLWYFPNSDKSDYLQGAYVMMKERHGDCFNYFALAKLMFERLGIDNIDVRKVKNYEGDVDHFWSLVSLDGGKTWYHFDATPCNGPGDEFCLVTDAFLDAYSVTHNNTHNRDKSLYPSTPEA